MIDTLVLGNDALHIGWSDGFESEHLWLWLRDHSHDDDTFHGDTMQRQLDTAAVPSDLRGVKATIVGHRVEIGWFGSATSPSVLPIEFLHRFRSTADEHVLPDDRVLWDGTSILDEWPTIEHETVMATDDGVAEWLEAVARFGFCFVSDVPTTTDATEALLRRVGYVRETVFGGMWDFRADLSMADTAYTPLTLRPHTDGTYSRDAPGLQLLHCLAFDGTGGESTMVDGYRVAAQLRMADSAAYEVLSTVPVPGQYLGDGVHLRAERPVFRHRRDGLLEQVSFNNYDRAPFMLPPDEMRAFYDALRALEQRVNDPRLQWRRAMQPGEAMLFDNWRVLHGRLAYTGNRHLSGGYLNREDWESRRRMLTTRR